MAQGKPEPSARKRSQRPPRVGVNEAETFVEAIDPALTLPQDMDDLYVDDAAGIAGRNGKRSDGKARAAKAPERKASSARPGNGQSASLVDADSESRKRRKAKRAAERRRARGEAPVSVDGTNTALQQRLTPDPGASGQLNYAAGVLTCVKGPEEGLALNLLEGTYTIGRGRENSFVLKDIAASRRHVRVEVAQHQVTVEDMGSGNGTRVNGKRIEKARLKNGDRVELGNSVLVFTFLGDDGSQSVPTTTETLAKDAQARIVEAAERLAAELNDRLRDEEERAAPAAAPPARAQAASAPVDNRRRENARGDTARSDNGRIDSALDEVLTASANREHRREGGRPQVPMPDALWNETETRIPLSDVVPADEPLRPREATSPAPPSTMSPPSLEPLNAKAPRGPTPKAPSPKAAPSPKPPSPKAGAPKAPPPGVVPPRNDEPPPAPANAPHEVEPPLAAHVPPVVTPGPAMGMNATTSDAQRSLLLGIALAFVAVLLLGGGSLAGYWFLLREPPATADRFAEVTARATEALATGDYDAALAFAEHAQTLRPDDAATKALLIAIRTAKAEAEDKPATAPSTSPDDAMPAGDPSKADDAASKRDDASAVAASSSPAPRPEPAAAPPAPKPAPKPEPARVEPPSKPEPVVARPKPRPKPRPARRPARPAPRPRGMSDSEAKSVYVEAMRAVRGDDEQRGCALIRKVAREAPADSNWKVKANNALGRYGCE